MIFLTTTAIDIDEELLNRCLVLTVDEDREQTRAIHRIQREAQTLEGLLARQRARRTSCKLHRNAQRLLKPLAVVNPYRRQADVSRQPDAHAPRSHEVPHADPRHHAAAPIPAARAKRADHAAASRLEYIEVDAGRHRDWPTDLAQEVLGRSLDELPPQTRRLLLLIDEMVQARMRAAQDGAQAIIVLAAATFAQYTGWGDTAGEEPPAQAGGAGISDRASRRARPELRLRAAVRAARARSGQPLLPGLIDVEKLDLRVRRKPKSGQKRRRTRPSTPSSRGRCSGVVRVRRSQ